jgi:hypothetical protein
MNGKTITKHLKTEVHLPTRIPVLSDFLNTVFFSNSWHGYVMGALK